MARGFALDGLVVDIGSLDDPSAEGAGRSEPIGDGPAVHVHGARSVRRAHTMLEAEDAGNHGGDGLLRERWGGRRLGRQVRRHARRLVGEGEGAAGHRVVPLEVGAAHEVSLLHHSVQLRARQRLVEHAHFVHHAHEALADLEGALTVAIQVVVRPRGRLKALDVEANRVPGSCDLALGIGPIHHKESLVVAADADAHVVPLATAVAVLRVDWAEVVVVVEEGGLATGSGAIPDGVSDAEARVGAEAGGEVARRAEGHDRLVPSARALGVDPRPHRKALFGANRHAQIRGAGHLGPVEVQNLVVHLDLVAPDVRGA
mmetsp:Transcript_17603/g.36000  ORF Transcript_17603/g.36000 Transcript_17603/m.36000 type:complete len:316 (-) Transcript_17603:671-1618(-)